jgi:hypothetical protein
MINKILLISIALFSINAHAVFIPITKNTYIDASKSNSNSQTLSVSKTATTLLYFDLKYLPANTSQDKVSKATLWLFGNSSNTQSNYAVSIYPIRSNWSSSSNTMPFMNNAILTTVISSGANYIGIDITNQVKAWLSKSSPNYGIAISPANLALSTTYLFDAKNNTNTAHPPMLDIVLKDIIKETIIVDNTPAITGYWVPFNEDCAKAACGSGNIAAADNKGNTCKDINGNLGISTRAVKDIFSGNALIYQCFASGASFGEKVAQCYCKNS